MPTTVQKAKELPASHRVILDWLCRQPCRVYDFAEIADATKSKRGEVENVLRDLQHQRFGGLLKLTAPDGLRLRARHAFLPHDSPARVGYPACAPPDPTQAEHPTVRQIRINREEQAKAGSEAAAKAAESGELRKVQHLAYKKAKHDAREKAAENRPTKAERQTTGYALPEVPLGPPGPAPSPVAAPAAKAPKAPASRAPVLVKKENP